LAGAAAKQLEYHHVHRQATLKNRQQKYSKAETNDLANYAFYLGQSQQEDQR
jgi:hypothetical protein